MIPCAKPGKMYALFRFPYQSSSFLFPTPDHEVPLVKLRMCAGLPQVTNDKSDTAWCIAGYEGKTNIVIKAKGTGGRKECLAAIADDTAVVFGACTFFDGETWPLLRAHALQEQPFHYSSPAVAVFAHALELELGCWGNSRDFVCVYLCCLNIYFFFFLNFPRSQAVGGGQPRQRAVEAVQVLLLLLPRRQRALNGQGQGRPARRRHGAGLPRLPRSFPGTRATHMRRCRRDSSAISRVRC